MKLKKLHKDAILSSCATERAMAFGIYTYSKRAWAIHFLKEWTRLQRQSFETVEELSDTKRGSKGFGSTDERKDL